MRSFWLPTTAFLEAAQLFERLIALVLPAGHRAERVQSSATSLVVEVRLWQGEDWLFSLRLPADATHLVMHQWQQFLRQSQRTQERLLRPLSEEELRLLARPLLLELLRALDD